MRRELADPRAWQIAALAALLDWNVTQLSMGAALLPSLVAIAATVGTQALAVWLSVSVRARRLDKTVALQYLHGEEACRAISNPWTASSFETRFALLRTRLRGAGRRTKSRLALFGHAQYDLRSPLITGLSLALLLRGDALWVPAVAGMLAVASKFLIRIDGKHLFNPAAFAILALILSGHAWVSPGQWGQSTLLVAAMVFLAILVLSQAARLDTALAFLAAHAGLLVARALWLGDPLAIPLHQLQNGALLLFAFFMITDPKTTPDARPALYVSLVAMSLIVPILDRIFPAERFLWRPSQRTKS